MTDPSDHQLDKPGRKKFYEYFCPADESHEILMFKNKHLCKQCTEATEKHFYMNKRCRYCKQDMKNSEKHYYQCLEFAKIKKPSNMNNSLNSIDRVNLSSRILPILPNALNSYVQYLSQHQNLVQGLIDKQNVEVKPTRDQILIIFEQIKKGIADPLKLSEGITKLEQLMKMSQGCDIRHLDYLDMQAVLSVCKWKKGEKELANTMLEICIQKALDLNEIPKWMEWTKWYAVREIQCGNYKHAQGLTLPIIVKIQKDPLFLPEKQKQSAYFNTFGMALVGLTGKTNYELAEQYFLKSIELDPQESVYLHNISDLYKKLHFEHNEAQCLDHAIKNAEIITNPVYMKSFRTPAPASLVSFCNNLSELYLHAGRIDDAETTLKIGFEQVEKYHMEEELGNARLFETFARLMLMKGNTVEAHQAIQKSVNIGRHKLKGTIHLEKFERLFDEITIEILKSPTSFSTDQSLFFDHSLLEFDTLDFDL